LLQSGLGLGTLIAKNRFVLILGSSQAEVGNFGSANVFESRSIFPCACLVHAVRVQRWRQEMRNSKDISGV